MNCYLTQKMYKYLCYLREMYQLKKVNNNFVEKKKSIYIFFRHMNLLK